MLAVYGVRGALLCPPNFLSQYSYSCDMMDGGSSGIYPVKSTPFGNNTYFNAKSDYLTLGVVWNRDVPRHIPLVGGAF